MNPKFATKPPRQNHRPLWTYRWLRLSYGALTGMAIVLILGILLLSTSQHL